MLPVVCVTMGDPAGVGPEIVVKALLDPEIYGRSRPFVVGDAQRLVQASRLLGAEVNVRTVQSVSDCKFSFGTIDCLDLGLVPEALPFGEVSAVAGNAAFRYIEKAVQLAMNAEISAICTAPLNKEALHKGGHNYPGHTEILASLTGTMDYAMMLTAPNLRVIHATTHVGIVDAIEQLTWQRVYKTIVLGANTLKQAGIAEPRIAVCGINPHAGENGLFGRGEEEIKILPALAKARQEGLAVTGPLPADTVFFRAVRGEFDLVVAMYHDQGHVPVKLLGFETGVNVTVGLPLIRTSVDHGTAFDIAGKGVASEASLKEALYQAVALSPTHK